MELCSLFGLQPDGGDLGFGIKRWLEPQDFFNIDIPGTRNTLKNCCFSWMTKQIIPNEKKRWTSQNIPSMSQTGCLGFQVNTKNDGPEKETLFK